MCDRLWFNKDFKRVTPKHYELLQKSFAGCDVKQFKVCATCLRSLNIKQIPSLSKSNGFSYPPKPVGLPPLDTVSERLISPRLPFMIVGQVMNVPVDVNNMEVSVPGWLCQEVCSQSVAKVTD